MCVSYSRASKLRFSYPGARVFANREFSFTLKGDIYIRYQSFNNRKEMEKAIMDREPHKIDIGAVYNARVCSSLSLSLSLCA